MVFREQTPDINEYWELFLTTGWNEEYDFSIHDLSEAIQHSWYAISVYDADNLVGFGRVISDGVHHALIADLIIHPDHQGHGLGSKLLERLVQKCKEHRIRDIQLFSAEGKHSFYEKYGFEKRPPDAPGMQLKDY